MIEFMGQYIDKSVLVAEIEKTEKISKDASEKAVDTYFKIHFDGWVTACRSILSFIDTLEVKDEPVSDGLEEAAWMYYDKNKPLIPHELDLHKELISFFIAGAQWQKEYILDDDNKQYHRLRHKTLKRLYENEAKLELMLDKALEGYIEKYEQIGGHNYLSLKIPMLSKPDDCKDGDKIKLIILKEE